MKKLLQEILKEIKKGNKLWNRNNWLTGLAILAAFSIAIGITVYNNSFDFGGGTNSQAELFHLNHSFLLRETPRGFSKGAIISNLETNPLLALAQNIIACESNGNQNAIGQQGEIGIAQFKQKTWDWMCGLSGKDLDIHNPQHQLELLLWALENDYENHWACYKE